MGWASGGVEVHGREKDAMGISVAWGRTAKGSVHSLFDSTAVRQLVCLSYP